MLFMGPKNIKLSEGCFTLVMWKIKDFVLNCLSVIFGGN